MKKRLLSFMLVFAMVLGMIPAQALAAEPEASGVTIEDAYCTVDPALDYTEGESVTYYQYGSESAPLVKYVVQIPAGTDMVTLTVGNNICLTPDYYDYTQFNFYCGTMTWSEDADGYGTPGYQGRTTQVTYTAVSEGVSSIELDVASLIAGGKLFYTIDAAWNPLYAIEFEYAAASGGHECIWNAGEVTKVATCKETGVKIYTCTVKGCGKTMTEDLPLADHNWNTGNVTATPTCKMDGAKSFVCQTGGCTATKTETIKASADYHQWNGGEVTKVATCKEEGVTTFTCQVENCGTTKTSPIAKLTTHTYGEDGNAEYCTVCATALNPNYVDPNMPQQVEGVYQIGTAEQLLSFAKFVNKGNTNLSAVLTADIDLTGKTWTPMSSSDAFFSFDGQGHTITFDNAPNGLFAVLQGDWNNRNNYEIDRYAVVQNLIVSGTINGAGKIAAIVGEGYGVKIIKCVNRADITGSGNNVGGLLGFSDKSISGYRYSHVMIDQCANEGDIQGTSNVGGLAGTIYSGRKNYVSYITNSYNWGTVTGSNGGGLVGDIKGSLTVDNITITNSYNAGSAGAALVGKGTPETENTYYLSDAGDANASAVTEDVMKSAEFVTTLGEYFRKSSTYPILSWLATSGTEYAVTKPTNGGITFVGMEMAYSDEDYVFTVTINQRYRITDEFAILVNGGEVDVDCVLAEGVYNCTVAKENITSNLTVTVMGVEATKTVLYTGSSKPLSWLYVSEIAIDDVTVKSIRTEGDTIYVVLDDRTASDAEVYFTVAKDGTSASAMYMLNVSPAEQFSRKLNAGSLTEIITAEVANNDPCSWTIVITVDGITTYRVSLPTGTGYTVNGATAAVGGQDYTFTVDLDNTYIKGENFAVTVNGAAPILNADGSYTVKNVSADLTVAVTGVVEKPFEDPFVAIKVGDRTLTADEIELKTKDFHLGGKGEAFNFRVYENVPYYHVTVDAAVEWVEVIFKSVTDILTDTVARGYTTDIAGVDVVSSATIRGTSFQFAENSDGTKSLQIPVTGYTVNSKGGQAIGPEMEGQSQQPVALFSFLHKYTVSITETAAFSVIPQEGYATTVLGGDDFKFTVRANTGYSKSEDFAVKVDGESVTPDENGVYTIHNVTADHTVAVTGETAAETVTAYLSASHDAGFIVGNGGVAALQEVEVPWFDLSLYGLERYALGEDSDGYQKPTLLHLYIVATEMVYCGLEADAVGEGYLYENGLMPTLLNATQEPGSLYMANFWDYDENLRYFYNYEYPYYPGTSTGATSDRILLQEGDVATVGHFTDWEAHEDSANGFNYLVAGDNDRVTTSVEQGEQLVLTVRRAGGGMGGGSYDTVVSESVEVWYAAVDTVTSGNVTDWTCMGTAVNGVLSVEVELEPGTYIVAVAGRKGAATRSICSTPGGILLTVEEKVESDAERDAAAAKVVYDLIEAIPAEVTLAAETQIAAARTAYAQLSTVQKAMVFNYSDLIAAESALAALKDAYAAQAVDARIEAIGTVTLEDEEAIRAARIAYNVLTEAQKALVTKLESLSAAEAELERLKRDANTFADMYQATKAYLSALSAPSVGTTNGEWRVIGLLRAGGEVADSYYDNVVAYVKENIRNGRLHESKSTENSRVILALSALGTDVTNVGGYDLLSGLNEMDYINNQGVNGTIWALIAFDSVDYTIPAGDVSREALIAEILNEQKRDGGWSVSGDTYDTDMTGMAIIALAPYYTTNNQVKAAVDEALDCLSKEQLANGTFVSGGAATSESAAQVITALTALGIDPDTDPRFIKNGISALDALSVFYLGEGKFEHGVGSGYNTMATEQVFYAMVAYNRFKNGQTSLYDMSDLAGQNRVEILPCENGTVSVSKASASAGEIITVTVTADLGYQISKLTMNDAELTVTDNRATFTMPDGIAILEAVFAKTEGSAQAVAQAMTDLAVMAADEDTYDAIADIKKAYGKLTAAEKLEIADAYRAFQNKVAQYETYLKAHTDEAVEELEWFFEELDEDDYSKTTWKKIKKLYTEAVEAVRAARFEDEVFELLEEYLEKLEIAAAGDLVVTFRLIGDWKHDDGVHDHDEYVTWIKTTEYTMPAESTMYDLLIKALEDADLNQKGASKGYVESIQAPDILGAYWLGEFDNGRNSGWMYTVNGDHPDYGLKEWELTDGDEVIWHYVDDYTLEERKPSSQYYERWLEADDISPETYVKRNLDKMVTVEGKGNVTPELKTSHLGKNVKFTFTPAEGWYIKTVYVDGENKGAIDTYTYKKLAMNARIRVVFAQNAVFQLNFADVSEADWFCEDVRFAVENGLFNGLDENTFSPNTSMTRAMLVTVLYRLAEQPAVTGGSAFADVEAGQWYTDAVIWATRNGIVNGLGNGKFGTNDNVTREQMAAILYRYAQNCGYDTTARANLNGYTDAAKISAYAQEAMSWANAMGLLNGRTATTLAPNGTATRAEVAAIFHRFVENIVK